VATKIKLMRIGKMREPHYRIVVADARTKRDGRAIEAVGEYHPKDEPSTIKVDSDRVQYWLGVGAQPTESVAAILRVTGDWQKFKGLPAPEPMKIAAPRPDRRAAFEEAAREGLGAGGGDAATPRKRAPKSAPKADAAKTDAKADAAKADAAKADAAKADAAKAGPAPAEEAAGTAAAAPAEA
jgi:small subunit ribosomal protein S16